MLIRSFIGVVFFVRAVAIERRVADAGQPANSVIRFIQSVGQVFSRRCQFGLLLTPLTSPSTPTPTDTTLAILPSQRYSSASQLKGWQAVGGVGSVEGGRQRERERERERENTVDRHNGGRRRRGAVTRYATARRWMAVLCPASSSSLFRQFSQC